ncbi:MAG: ADOP family duplicated permease [Vicinamibacterales bacterium]
MREVRDAVRALRSTPLVTACAVFSLALGLGATTAIFLLLDSLLFKALPVPNPQTLVAAVSGTTGEDLDLEQSVWEAARERPAFARCFAWTSDRVDLANGGVSQFADAIWASGDMFGVLGIQPQAGRLFGTEDDRPTGGPDGAVAVISDAFWRSRFAASPHAVGSMLTIERTPYRIIGVAPAGFFGVDVGHSFDVLLPLATQALLGRRFAPYVQIMGRLGDRQEAAALTSAWRAAQSDIRDQTMPRSARGEDREAYLREPWTAQPAPGGTSPLRDRYLPALRLLLAAALAVALIACANVAMLMLGRSAARQYEFAVRRALGASGARVARQLAIESAIVSIAGSALGFAFALWTGPLLVRQLNTWAGTTVLDLTPDVRVLAAAAVAAMAAAVLFGAAPSIATARVPAARAIRSPTTVAARFRSGDILVVAQLALSTILIVASGLFVRSFTALAYRDLGFDRHGVTIAVVDLRRTPADPEARLAFFGRLRDAAASAPGVSAAALSLATPVGPSGVRMMADLEMPGAAARSARLLSTPVGPGWFQVYGTRLLDGRDFDGRDTRGAPAVAIVNRAFARRFFGEGGDPVGRTIVEKTRGGGRTSLSIVGMVEDAAFTSVRAPLEPVLYKPLWQVLDARTMGFLPTISISLRGAAGIPRQDIESGAAAAIERVDPEGSLTFQHLDAQLDYFYIRERLLAMIAGFFGVLGLVLAAVGLYGVTAYSVRRRRREIGIRMALGADRGNVRRLVLRRFGALSAAGLCAGSIGSFWLARTIASLLYGVHAHDAFAFAAGLIVLSATAAIAAWAPARHASRLDPAVVLRDS